MSFASDAATVAEREVTSLQKSHALRIAKKYLRLERLNDPIIHRFSMYDYMRSQGVVYGLIAQTIDKVDSLNATQ